MRKSSLIGTVKGLAVIKQKTRNNTSSVNDNDDRSVTKKSIKSGSRIFETKNQSHIKSPIPSDKSGFANDSFEKIMDDGKGTLKEMIENANVDQKVLNLIGDTIELFNDNMHETLSKEEKEKYELIEKTELEKLKRDNEEYKAEKAKTFEENTELTKNFNKSKTELNMLTQSYNHQQKNKHEFVNKIYLLQDNLKDLLLSNHKLNEMINKERVEKDNLFRALVTLTKKNNYKIPPQLKEIYQKFNNDYYSSNLNVNNSEKIELLKSRVEHLRNVLEEKNIEIDNKKAIIKQNIENKLIIE